MRFVVRCLPTPTIQRPTDISAQAPGVGAFVELVRSNPDEFLELAWIVRKKPIWSPS